jgi:hypothetical protein
MDRLRITRCPSLERRYPEPRTPALLSVGHHRHRFFDHRRGFGTPNPFAVFWIMLPSCAWGGLCVSLIHTVKLHDVQPDDPIGDFTNNLFISRRAVPQDVVRRISRMLFVCDLV